MVGTVRLHLVKKLFEELMGPKDPHERIRGAGRRYFVGILKPKLNDNDFTAQDPEDTATQQDPGSDDSVPSEYAEEKDLPDRNINPGRGVSSMGMSFVVTGKDPEMDVCVTWGRYVNEAADNFQRLPNFFIKKGIRLDSERQDIRPGEGDFSEETRLGAVLTILTKKIAEDARHVSVFLVNNTKRLKDEEKGANHHLSIYQPQIRINCTNNSQLQKLDIIDVGSEPEFQQMLYAKRGNFGKGHMCGIMWKEVDPEEYGQEGFSEFSWPDSRSKCFPENLVKEFTCPDIRSEFFPTYTVPQPKTSESKFDAEQLSHICNPDKLKERLSGIADRYDSWINKTAGEYPQTKNMEINLDNCKTACERIRDGIKFLESNEKARLAFCFMNKAMSLNAEWSSSRPASGQLVRVESFAWREFQMAFILHCLRSVAGKDKKWGDKCDVLWFPTGGGKTEAYLGLTIFTTVFRRLQKSDTHTTDGGVSVISRYTLRLLTIQQFQRAVGAITASEYLRMIRWMPDEIVPSLEEIDCTGGHVWGDRRISIGLLIGGSATPNTFRGSPGRNGIKEILAGEEVRADDGEPSQVLECPCCHTTLVFPTSDKTETQEPRKIHWIFRSQLGLKDLRNIPKEKFKTTLFNNVQSVGINPIGDAEGPKGTKYYEIGIVFTKKKLSSEKLSKWWAHVSKILGGDIGDQAELASTSAQRPGYFFVKEGGEIVDFAIYCPNSQCALNNSNGWNEGDNSGPKSLIPSPFASRNSHSASSFMPIPAFTYDEQIFRKCPSMIISTVDKFALMPFKEEFSSIFGNINAYNDSNGYGRIGITDYIKDESSKDKVHHMKPFLPPSLVIQDELHLIEGPLGSMVGAYEVALEILASGRTGGPKYIASSATVGEVGNLVGAIYRSEYSIFPPRGATIDDNYFSSSVEDPRSEREEAGRLYMGVCAPTGVLRLPVRVWAALLSEVWRIRQNPEKYGLNPNNVKEKTDPYWTLVGYFNAKKDLQKARGLYDDDITRDVDLLSPIRIPTYNYAGVPETLKAGIRFFPIQIDKDIELRKIIIHAHKKSVNPVIAIYDNNSGMPGKHKQTARKFSVSMSKGENEFELEGEIVHKGDIVWVSVANVEDINVNHAETNVSSYVGSMTEKDLTTIVNGGEFPEVLKVDPSDTMIQLTLVGEARSLGTEPIELTGNTESHELPEILRRIGNKENNSINAVFTTSVFGTGIDIDRLGLMVMMGQSKTTSSYIQSTGRIGRRHPGLVVTSYKASNIRDLNHYEDFVGYHRMLQRFVEPLTASPFAEESLRLCLGPLLVSILRNLIEINDHEISTEWVDNENGPARMGKQSKAPEITMICDAIKSQIKNKNIPNRLSDDECNRYVANAVSCWHKFLHDMRLKKLHYYEWALNKPPQKNVVLGTTRHNNKKGINVVFKNVRTSMRNVESTANFGWSDG
ncbi:MAG: helicase C-terminal domain-containing protein [Alphaproteobacteria bacterium]|nr:helicase C-terminal domain-containing protein [Alphaproteobacteria bacterium]